MSFWSWSFYLFRFRGIDVRVHWSVLLLLIYDLHMYTVKGWPWWMGPILAAVLLVSILLHEFGHAFAARSVGGSCNRVVLWGLGGLAECEQPMRPWPHFAVAAAGPLVTGSLCAIGWLSLHALPEKALSNGIYLLQMTASYLFLANGRMLLLNLLPCYPMDGSRMLTSALWPWVGARNASLSTLWVSYPCVVGLLVWAIWQDNMVVLLLSLSIFAELVQQHSLSRSGGVNVFGIDTEASWQYRQQRTDGSWFSRWRDRRRQRISEQRDREETAEQQMVDDLLAKVGATGLSSLTKQEKAILESYSRKQRERQLIGRD